MRTFPVAFDHDELTVPEDGEADILHRRQTGVIWSSARLANVLALPNVRANKRIISLEPGGHRSAGQTPEGRGRRAQPKGLRRMIQLSHEGFDLGVVPEAGGSVAWLRQGGIDLLRPARGRLDAEADPLEMAAFPMVPFSGRIGRGRFVWNGREIALTPNFHPEAHAIHGHGWLSVWDVTEVTDAGATLQYRHDADDWPWAYLAEQKFVLSKGGLSIELRLTNLSEETMPAGLGWHPYFPRGDARLFAETLRVWPPGADKLPGEARRPGDGEHLVSNPPVNSLSLDHAFETRDGVVEIEWPSRQLTIRLQTDGTMRHLVVFAPPGQDFFCAEPASHVPNMVNMAAPAKETGLVALPPGETLVACLSLWPRLVSASAKTARRATAG